MSSQNKMKRFTVKEKNHLVFCFWAVVHRMSQNTSQSSTVSSEFITELHTSSPAPFLPCGPCLSPLSLHLCSVPYICPFPHCGRHYQSQLQDIAVLALPRTLPWSGSLDWGCLISHRQATAAQAAYTLDGFLPEGGHLQEKYPVKGRHEQLLSCFLLRFWRP